MNKFDNIYADQHSRMIRYAQTRFDLRDDTAEQIVSDTFMDLHIALQKGVEINSPAGWLHAAIRTRYAEFLRVELRTKRGGQLQKFPLRSWENCMAIDHPEFEAIDAADTWRALWTQLTVAEQQIASLVFMREFTHTEAANQLSVSVRTVERRVVHVRNRLRELLPTL